jgi:hypothetical protein
MLAKDRTSPPITAARPLFKNEILAKPFPHFKGEKHISLLKRINPKTLNAAKCIGKEDGWW